MFALVSKPELNLLITLPKSCIVVYLALASHCRDHSNCFPSINTLKRLLAASKITERTIYKALAKLEAIGLILRNHRRSTNRFVLRVREMWMSLRKAACSNGQGEQGQKKPHKKRRKERLRNKGKNQGFRSQLLPAQIDLKEEIMARYITQNLYDERLHELMSEKDWSWLRQYHPQKAQHLDIILSA